MCNTEKTTATSDSGSLATGTIGALAPTLRALRDVYPAGGNQHRRTVKSEKSHLRRTRCTLHLAALEVPPCGSSSQRSGGRLFSLRLVATRRGPCAPRNSLLPMPPQTRGGHVTREEMWERLRGTAKGRRFYTTLSEQERKEWPIMLLLLHHGRLLPGQVSAAAAEHLQGRLGHLLAGVPTEPAVPPRVRYTESAGDGGAGRHEAAAVGGVTLEGAEREYGIPTGVVAHPVHAALLETARPVRQSPVGMGGAAVAVGASSRAPIRHGHHVVGSDGEDRMAPGDDPFVHRLHRRSQGHQGGQEHPVQRHLPHRPAVRADAATTSDDTRLAPHFAGRWCERRRWQSAGAPHRLSHSVLARGAAVASVPHRAAVAEDAGGAAAPGRAGGTGAAASGRGGGTSDGASAERRRRRRQAAASGEMDRPQETGRDYQNKHGRSLYLPFSERNRKFVRIDAVIWKCLMAICGIVRQGVEPAAAPGAAHAGDAAEAPHAARRPASAHAAAPEIAAALRAGAVLSGHRAVPVSVVSDRWGECAHPAFQVAQPGGVRAGSAAHTGAGGRHSGTWAVASPHSGTASGAAGAATGGGRAVAAGTREWTHAGGLRPRPGYGQDLHGVTPGHARSVGAPAHPDVHPQAALPRHPRGRVQSVAPAAPAEQRARTVGAGQDRRGGRFPAPEHRQVLCGDVRIEQQPGPLGYRVSVCRRAGVLAHGPLPCQAVGARPRLQPHIPLLHRQQVFGSVPTSKFTRTLLRVHAEWVARGWGIRLQFVDEYRTTKCCWRCGRETVPMMVCREDDRTGRSHHAPSMRLRVCPDCSTQALDQNSRGGLVDRDVNASRHGAGLSFCTHYEGSLTARPDCLNRAHVEQQRREAEAVANANAHRRRNARGGGAAGGTTTGADDGATAPAWRWRMRARRVAIATACTAVVMLPRVRNAELAPDGRPARRAVEIVGALARVRARTWRLRRCTPRATWERGTGTAGTEWIGEGFGGTGAEGTDGDPGAFHTRGRARPAAVARTHTASS
eukprot:ctg_2638.g456